MSDVFVCVVRGVINVNKFEVRLLPSSHLNVRLVSMWQQSGTLLFGSCHGIARVHIYKTRYTINYDTLFTFFWEN